MFLDCAFLVPRACIIVSVILLYFVPAPVLNVHGLLQSEEHCHNVSWKSKPDADKSGTVFFIFFSRFFTQKPICACSKKNARLLSTSVGISRN